MNKASAPNTHLYSYLHNLQEGILEQIFWDLNSLATLNNCYQSCKTFKYFIDRKKLFERYITSGTFRDIQIQKLLTNFYFKKDIFHELIFIFKFLKREEPYFQLYQCITKKLKKEKIDFINHLNSSFQIRVTDNINCSIFNQNLKKLFILADDFNPKISQKSQQALISLLLINNDSEEIFNESQKNQINECLIRFNTHIFFYFPTGIAYGILLYGLYSQIIKLVLQILDITNTATVPYINTLFQVNHFLIYFVIHVTPSMSCFSKIINSLTYGIHLHPDFYFHLSTLITLIFIDSYYTSYAN